MASIPKPTCQICRVAKAVNEQLKKSIKLYVFFALIIIELFSIYYQQVTTPKRYVEFVYPLLTQIDLFLIFVALLYHSERLRFCKRQKLIVGFLGLYYLMNIIFLIFPICWTDYVSWVNYSILTIIGLLFISTWRNL